MQTHPNDAAEPADNDGAPEGFDPGQRISELEQALLQVRDEQLRERAELDNQRKRLARELEQARRFANDRLLAELLPVIDNLERGLAVAVAVGEAETLREGVDLTLKQLIKVVEDHGITVVDPLGHLFNPEQHQAVGVEESAEHPANTVVRVMQKGYLLNGRLLRPALVMVSG